MTVWIQNPFDNLPCEGYRKQRFWLMSEAFAAAGHQVVFWTSDFSHLKKSKRSFQDSEISEGAEVSGVSGVRGLEGGNFEVRLIPTLPYKSNVCWARIRSHRAYAKSWLRLALESASEPSRRPDVIISSMPSISAAETAMELGRRFGAKVVVDVMDAWPETFERLAPKGFRWIAHLLLTPLRLKVRRLYREADIVTGVCERYRALTSRSDYYLAYHGVDLSANPPIRQSVNSPIRQSGNPPVRLVYAGTLGRTYDLDTVLRAVAENSDFTLDIAGRWEGTVPERVRAHGYLGQDELERLLETCDVGVIPMAPDSWVGMPYKICDYAKAGLRIVSSLGGESSALLEKYACGATYRAGDAASFAEAVRRAMTCERGASRQMCEEVLDAAKIYRAYVAKVAAHRRPPCSEKKRIAVNVAATYGRSLYALAVGLFSSRWLLMVLGESDYGLYGLIGGLSFVLAFFNTLLTGAVERFLAVSVGSRDVEDCRRWFSLALAMHVVLGLTLVGVGYPLGLWAIRHGLNIPPDRLDMCADVFGFVALECLVGMLTVPFNALYVAKQRLAELTVYGLVQTTVNVLVLGYMVLHPGTWLVAYAGWLCAVRVVPMLLISARAACGFPECRFRLAFVRDGRRFRQIVDFMGSRFVCLLGQLFAGQGLAVVVNRYLGVTRNASVTVSNTVSYQTSSLSGALSAAFMPAIMNVAGAGDLEKMRAYALRVSLFSSLALLLFAIPLALEMDEVLKLWLVNPPVGASGLCICLLAVAVLEKLTEGHWMAIAAIGRIRASQFWEALTFFGSFLLGWALMAGGMDVLAMGLALIAGRVAADVVKVRFGLTVAALPVGPWLKSVVAPTMLSVALVVLAGAVPRFLMEASFLRVAVTSLACLLVFLPTVWFFVLPSEDRLSLAKRGFPWVR